MTWERLLRQRYNYNEIERALPTERLSFRRKLLSCPPGVNVVPPEQQLPTHLPLQPTPLQVMRHGCSLYNDDLTGDITSRKGGPELQTLPISVSGKEVAKVSRRPRPSWMHWILALVLRRATWTQYIPTSHFPSPESLVPPTRSPRSLLYNVPGI